MSSLSLLLANNSNESEPILICYTEANSSSAFGCLKETNDILNNVLVRNCKNCNFSFRGELNPQMIEFCSKGAYSIYQNDNF
jgi:hypothetical protein